MAMTLLNRTSKVGVAARPAAVAIGALLLFVTAGTVSAGTILEIQCDESRGIYDTHEARHISHPVCDLDVEGAPEPSSDWFIRPSWFDIAETFTGLTLETNSNGDVVRSHYSYTGGTFDVEFSMSNDLTGEHIFGDAPLPILSMDVFSWEGPAGRHVEFFATLGSGLLDASVARALGIGQNILGGTLSDRFLGRRDLIDTDYTADGREASEGAPTLRLDVPEPSLLMLCFLGAAAMRRRLSRS